MHFSLLLFLTVFVVLHRFGICQEYEIDDEHPDEENFCVLDEQGNPVNCSENLEDDGLIRSTMHCTGSGEMGMSCKFENICYDGRDRNYTTVAAAYLHLENSSPHYIAEDDWVFFTDDSTTQIPAIGLLGHKSPNKFTATVSTNLPAEDDVLWVNGNTLLTFRQYHANYYHIIMDDMIGMWWTMQNHFPETPRDLTFVLLDDHKVGGIDVATMLQMLTTGEIVNRQFLHEQNRLVCFRRAIVGPAERSWGGPGRRYIKDPMLRDFHAFMRTGAMRLADAERELLEEGELEVDPESPFNVDDLRATDDVVRPRVAVLLRKGTRKIVNEAEMMAGLRAAFPFAEFFELRTEGMPSIHQAALMRNSTMMIGVHGAGLTNHMFMPAESSLVEIMPFNWERHAYGRISFLLGYHYFAWRNKDRSKTVFHESVFDGIPGVSEEDKETIRTAESKPLNMKSPASLASEKYWINQDTIVDIDELVAIVKEAFAVGLNAQLLAHDEL